MDPEEEELLMLQAEMLHSQKEPAAKSTRVGGASKGSSSKQHEDVDLLHLEKCLPIVGEVRERVFESTRGLKTAVGDSSLLETTGSGFPRATHRSKSKFKFCREEERRNPAENNEKAKNGADIGNEADAILAGMDAEEIESAHKELLARLPGKTVEFLKNRGLHKSRAQEPAANVQRNRNRSATPETSMAPLTNGIAAPLQEERLPILQRIRFNISGEIEEILPEHTNRDALHASTLQRDLVRQTEGSVDNSGCYSLMEAKILARSTDLNQRAIGLRYLSSILDACKNHIWEDDCSIELGNVDGSTSSSSITWLNIWQHAIYSVQVTKVIRYAMDESKIKVLAEACHALVALVGLPDIGRTILRDADKNPSVGIPKCQVCHMQRSETNHWVAMPLNLLDQKEIYGNEEMETDEQDLARIDPISGMINMRILPRICYLLRQDDSITIRKDLMLVLIAFSMAGTHVGHQMVQTPHLVDTLISFLPNYTKSNTMDEISLLSVEILCTLLDYVEEWGNEKLVQKLSNFAMNALLCWRRNEGTLASLEAVMRLWRSLKLAGKLFTPFDDIYQHLCFYMFPEICFGQEYSGSLLVVGGREAFLTAAACTSAGHISSSCVSSILKDILQWCRQLVATIPTPRDFFALEDDTLSLIAAILQFMQCLLQNTTIWEDKQEFEADKDTIRNIIDAICQSIVLADGVPKGFWSQGSSCTCRMAIISTFMNIVYLLDSSVLESTTMPQKLLDSMEQIEMVQMRDVDILQPWDMKRQQYYLQMARLVDSIGMNVSNPAEMRQIAQLNMRILSLVPPGSEYVGLRLLSLMFGDCAKHFIQLGLSEMHTQGLQYTKVASMSQSLDDYTDELRVQALHGLSSMMGYELQDASGWGRLKHVQSHYSHTNSILHGEDSMFPLADTWIFATSGNMVDIQRSMAWYQGTMAWILGMEVSGVLQYLRPAIKHVSLIRSLFDRKNKEEGSMLAHDSTVRLLGSVLIGSYMMSILPVKEFQPGWTLPQIRQITQNFVTESYGDSFFGVAMVTMFCDQLISPEWQEEMISILKDGLALQYLPTASEYPLDLGEQLVAFSHERKSMKLQFLLDVIASDAFARALESESLSVDIIMHHALRAVEHTSKESLKLVSNRLSRYEKIHGVDRAMKYLDL